MADERRRSDLSRWRDGVRDSNLRAPEKAAAFVIATYMNGNGICWPSTLTIARGASLSERAVRNAVSVLEHRGFLDVERSAGRTSHRYRIPTRHTVPRSTRQENATNPAHGAAESNRTQRGADLNGHAAYCTHCQTGGGRHTADCEYAL